MTLNVMWSLQLKPVVTYRQPWSLPGTQFVDVVDKKKWKTSNTVTSITDLFTPVLARYDPFGVDVPLNCDIIIIHSP